MKIQVQSLASLSGLRIHCLLWLWHRPAAAAVIQPLAQELQYAAGVAIKRKKKKKKIGVFALLGDSEIMGSSRGGFTLS